MDIIIDVPSLDEEVGLEVEPDQTVDSIIRTVCKNLRLGRSDSWKLMRYGTEIKTIDYGRRIRDIGIADGDKLNLVRRAEPRTVIARVSEPILTRRRYLQIVAVTALSAIGVSVVSYYATRPRPQQVQTSTTSLFTLNTMPTHTPTLTPTQTSTPVPSTPTGSVSDEEEVRSLMLAYFDAVNRHSTDDLVTFLDYTAKMVINNGAHTSYTLDGRWEIKEDYQEFFKKNPGTTFSNIEINDLKITGDKADLECKFRSNIVSDTEKYFYDAIWKVELGKVNELWKIEKIDSKITNYSGKSRSPSTPVLVSPKNGTVLEEYGSVTLEWEESDGAQPMIYLVHVQLQVISQSGTLLDWQDQETHQIHAKTKWDFLRGGAQPHRWRVKAANVFGESNWSNWWYMEFKR